MFKHPRPVLVIDNDLEFLALIVDFLVLEGFHPYFASTFQQATKVLESTEVDAIVCREDLPEGKTVDWLAELTQTSQTPLQNLPILFLLTNPANETNVVSKEKYNISKAYQQPWSLKNIAQDLRQMLSKTQTGVTLIANREVGPICMDLVKRQLRINGKLVPVTNTEFTILEVLINKVGVAVPKDEIYQKVLGRSMHRSERSIDVHISALRHKIQTADNEITISGIRRVGYRLIIKQS